MAESARQKRMRELGVSTSASSSVKSEPSTLSSRTKRMIKLGVIEHPASEANDIRANTVMKPIDFKGAIARLPKEDPYVSNFKASAERMVREQTYRPKELIKPQQELKGRDIPIVGPVLKGLDWLEQTRAQDIIANVGQALYTPGAGLANVAGFVGGVGSKLAQYAPKLTSTLGGRVATEAIKEGAVGVPLGMGQALTQGQDMDEVLKQGLLGGVLGAGTGGAIPLIGAGARKILDKYKPAKESPITPRLGLPEPRQRGNMNQAVTDDVITPEYTFKLDKPSDALMNQAKNMDEARADLSALDEEIRTLNIKQSEAVNDQFKLLSEQLKNRQGTVPKGVIKDAEGYVTGNTKGYSKNPEWYQEYYAQYGKVPNRRELYTIAKKQVEEGYTDFGTDIPSWKAQNNYDETVEALTGVRNQISRTLAERKNNITDATFKSDVMKVNQPIKGVARVEPTKPDIPKQTDDIPKGVFPEPVLAESVKQGWFERLFGEQAIGITPQIADGKRNILSTEGQIVDKPLQQTISGLVGTTKAAVRRGYQNIVDELDPIKKISKKAYDTSMDANRSNQLANVIVTDKFVDPQGNIMGEGLQNIVRKSGRGNYNAFTDYLIARHAVTRTARGEAVYAEKLGMTTEKIAERVNQLEKMYPGFKEIGQEWDNYYNNIRQVYGVEEGLIPKSLADSLKEKNPNYAPMKRQFTTEEKIKGLRGGVRPMFSGQKAPLQSVSPVGSTRKVVDPVRSTVEQTGAWVNAAMHNRTMVKIVDAVTADVDGMKGIVEIIQPPKGQPNLREVLETEGEERFLEMLQEDFNKLFSRSALDKDNVVRAMVKGEPVYMRIHDPEAVKALSSMGSDQAGITLAIFRAISNTVKRGATGALSPVFAAKSVTVDLLGALIQSENPIKHSGYLVGSVFSSIGDVLKIPGLRNMARDFERAGGGYSAALRGERGLKKSVSAMRLDPLLSPRTIVKGVGRTIAAPFKASTKIADMSENLNRIAAFNHKIRQLGERTPENVQEAMNYAREITTNYSRKGKWARSLEATFPYQNAAVQGLYRFAKAWKEHPVKTAAMVGTLVILPKLREYAMFADDEDYNDLPARERYRNIIWGKNEDGTFKKIPAPPEYAAIGALTVDMLRSYKDGDPEAFKGMSDAIMNAYTPPAVSGALQGVTQGGGIEQSLAGSVTSTSVGPVLGTFANQSFTGGPIESLRVAGRSPGMRYDERTSKVAKVLGEKLNYSPMKIDYILRSYGGDPARLGLPLTSDVGAGTVRNTLAKAWIVDPVFTNTLTDDYYRGKEELTQAYQDKKDVDAELPKWYNEGLRKYISSTASGSITKRISALTDQKKKISTDKQLSAEQKAQKIRDVQRKINEVYIEANAKMKKAGVPILNR